jgi:hypothetical protein
MNQCQNCGAVLPSRIDGQRGRPRKYCNRSCFAIASGYLKYAVKPEFCLFCGIDLNQINKPGYPKKFCSRKHNAQYRQANKPKAPKIQKSCLWCNTEFVTAFEVMKFCQGSCRVAFQNKQRADKTKAKHIANPRRFDFNCNRCGQSVISDICIRKTYSGRFCRNCSLVKRRERYRIKTAKRQKIVNPIRISADVLIERDGDVCHICLTQIDLSLARNSRFGATIDHVIPVSKGGADTLDNMKLAHWICNIKKGNKV